MMERRVADNLLTSGQELERSPVIRQAVEQNLKHQGEVESPRIAVRQFKHRIRAWENGQDRQASIAPMGLGVA